MTTKQILLILTISFLVFNQNLFAQEVKLMKVTNKSGENNPKLPYWKDAGVSLTGRQDTYLSIVNEPEKDKVKRVVFISAGQQSDSPLGNDNIFSGDYGEGYTNVLTGQPDNYKEGLRLTNNFNATRLLNSKSLASKLINSGKFPKESTLFVLAFDARFGYFRSEEEKKRRETAFFNFLTEKFDRNNVEVIVLAGQSRGGALMFRLGSRLRSNSKYSKIPLIVQGYDPVATNPILANSSFNTTLRKTPIEQYLPISSEKDILKNPNDYNNKYCWKVNMDVTFPPNKRENLKVLNLHAGGKVGLHNSIRAFAWTGENTQNPTWYKEWWLNFGHEEMGGCTNFSDSDCLFKTVEVGYQHIIYSIPTFKIENNFKFGSATTSFNGTLNSSNVDKGNGHFIVGVSDVNGDGRADLVTVSKNGNAYVYRGGKDYKFSNGVSSFNGTLNSANVGGGNGHVIVGVSDVNGDGRADLVTVSKNGNAYVYRGGKDYKFSNGVSSFNGTLNSANVGGGNGHYIVDVSDVNGDGRADLVTVSKNGNAYVFRGGTDYKFSNGVSSFNGTLNSANVGGGNGHFIVGVSDVNGDGRADLVTVSKNGNVYVYRGGKDYKFSNGVSSFNGTLNSANVGGGNGHYIVDVSDVNGDGRADLVTVSKNGNAYVYKGGTDYKFSNGVSSFNGTLNSSNVDKGEGHFIVGVSDVNGDRKADLISVHSNGNAYVWKAGVSKKLND